MRTTSEIFIQFNLRVLFTLVKELVQDVLLPKEQGKMNKVEMYACDKAILYQYTTGYHLSVNMEAASWYHGSTWTLFLYMVRLTVPHIIFIMCFVSRNAVKKKEGGPVTHLQALVTTQMVLTSSVVESSSINTARCPFTNF